MLVWVVSVRAYQPITVSICNNTMHRTLLTQCNASLLHMLHRRIRSHGRTYTSQQRLCKRYESLHTSAAEIAMDVSKLLLAQLRLWTNAVACCVALSRGPPGSGIHRPSSRLPMVLCYC